MDSFIATMGEFIQWLKDEVPSQIYAPIAVVVWVPLLWIFKRSVIRKLKAWAKKTSYRWDDIPAQAI